MVFSFIYLLLISLNARKYFLSFHEKYNIDEVFFALFITGGLGLLYFLLQANKMSKEIDHYVEEEKNLLWISNHDPITKLPNQKMLDSFVSSMDEENGAHSYAVFSVEINRFRHINDLLGYDSRNDIMKLVAQRLTYLFADNVYKLRGDDFLILRSNNDRTELLYLARRILKNITAPIGINGFILNTAANIGVARCHENVSSLSKVIQQSDCALHEAKKLGRDQVKVFCPVMQEDLLKRARFELDFKAALKNKALSLHYQPLVDLQSNTIVGFEALARWEQAPGKFIPPLQFVALAEETGAITELTEQLLRQACLDALQWPSYTLLSFNISPLQLSDKSLYFRIMRILNELSFPFDRLEIEVTESALFQDAMAARFTLTKLSDEGIQIALDDFGTGYSNLSQLCNFPFDKLKIDKSFIDTFLHNDKQDKIVRSLISLAGALDMKVTAEGIEHVNQLNRLKGLGCHIGQGYLLGKPAPQRDLQKI